MPTIISGPRQMRSFVSPSGAQVVTRVIDFNFASDQGIQVHGVLGSISSVDLSPTVSDTVPVSITIAQSLHLEEGTIEDVPFADGEDADQIDSEVFFAQHQRGMFQTGATATFGPGGAAPASEFYLPFAKPILVARNITHRGEAETTGQNGHCSVLLFYEYVRFSLQELGLILARRQ